MSEGAGLSGVELDLDQLSLQSPPAMPSSTPPLSSFRDITDEFIEASKKLEVGQLVQDPQFTLFQAIMDPKMDSGLLEPEYENFDAWQERLPEEIIGIMDRLLCNEMAWHLGSALSQTLFASLYVDKILSSMPTRLNDATFGPPRGEGHEIIQNILRPYCVAVIRCCAYANWQVPNEHIYDEEDFVGQTYGLPMLQAVSYKDMDNLLAESLVWLSTNKDKFTSEIYLAIRNRILLRKALLSNFQRDSDWKKNPEPQWEGCLAFIEAIEKDHTLAKEVPEAWSMSIQRKLASSVPPRPLVDLPFSEAISTVRKLCTETHDIYKLLDYAGASNVMSYFIHFGARQPTPLPYTRSLIQTLFCKDLRICGKLPIRDILYDDVRELCNPPAKLFDPKNDECEAPSNPKFQIAERMEWFIARAGRLYIELYKYLCQNRSRMRRILCKAMLEWDSMQVEAEEIDQELASLTKEQPKPFQGVMQYGFHLSSWVYHYKLRIMEQITLLGFELEIYPLHEFDGMYWYLQFYLKTRSLHIERMLAFVGNEPKSLSLLNFYLLENVAMHDLATACMLLYSALARYNLLEKPRNPQGSDRFRYEGRMKPFMSIGVPEVVQYDYFRNVVDNPDMDTSSLLHLASEHIAEAKKGYRQLSTLDKEITRSKMCHDTYKANISKLTRSCFGIGVAIGVLTREVDAGTVESSNLCVTLHQGAGYHASFPVPLVTSKEVKK
ncbi:Similar to N-alpha-acetyltransferase 35, NatC auxiliary subunit; acc. no. Q7T322 [Pyronema omphalodes CBS 100304]|uniref:Similar to N-alpha-acetyltransferase 35, NatC auxiliary subunit acc. no. Q7T322 n=1 Tax=Pyronema omphalodes (strain CBS 100304) TaxID=1076935 RepID=U4LNC1_PYROM|nr:Similar to N-alpha-acetyltransferase 35, NatC auxiliary subunit; acc. no. Q7T322 [Pyronema omphalodes CBS 100304]